MNIKHGWKAPPIQPYTVDSYQSSPQIQQTPIEQIIENIIKTKFNGLDRTEIEKIVEEVLRYKIGMGYKELHDMLKETCHEVLQECLKEIAEERKIESKNIPMSDLMDILLK